MRKSVLAVVILLLLIAAVVTFAQTRSDEPAAPDTGTAVAASQAIVHNGHLLVIRANAISVYDLRDLPKLTLVHVAPIPASMEEASVMVVRETAAKSGAPDGKAVYNSQGCGNCHKIGGKGGTTGPDLSHEGSKHDAAWIGKKITDPKATNPKSIMPPKKLPKDQLTALACYVAAQK